jgi:diguanylate cyclase (GGDEF)-like protein
MVKLNFNAKKKISLKTTVLSIFFLITIIMGIIFIIQILYFAKKLSYESINIKLEGLSSDINRSIKSMDKINENIILLLNNISEPNLKLYKDILENNSNLYAVYSGFKNNGFYELINLDIHNTLRDLYNAKVTDKWLFIRIDSKDSALKKIVLLNKDLEETKSYFEKTDYKSNTRPWYKKALINDNIIKTDPYKFSNIPSKGITYAKRVAKSNTVVGIDVLIYDIRKLFEKHIKNSYSNAFLLDKNMNIISSLKKSEKLEKFLSEIENKEGLFKPTTVNIDGIKYVVQINTVNKNEYLAFFSQYEKLISFYKKQTYEIMIIFLLSILFLIPLVIYSSRIIVKPIDILTKQSRKVEKREFKDIKIVETSVLEVAELSNSMYEMSQAIHSYQHSLEKKVIERTKQLKKKNEELLKLSITDKLTSLYNRVKIDKVLKEQYELAKRYSTPFSLILMDIDFFKKVNDNYGHKIGDDVLIETAKILKKTIRKTDILGRWGGEEFMVITPHTTQDGAVSLAKELNKAVANHQYSTYEKRVTISLGVCSFEEKFDIDKMTIKADEALYRAKENGRDRVEVYS